MDGRVIDLEVFLKFLTDFRKEGICVVFFVHQQMNSQSIFCRAHGPDVQIMNFQNAGLLG